MVRRIEMFRSSVIAVAAVVLGLSAALAYGVSGTGAVAGLEELNLALPAAVHGPLPLQYVSASNGLGIKMDGGRTEIEFADVNGDGNMDIVSVGDHGSPLIGTQEHGVMVWFGDGRGAQGKWTLFQNGNFGYGGVALGDVNNDGLMDVAFGIHHNYSSDDFGNRIEGIALGDGTGMNWTPWDQGVASNGETYGMAGSDLADVNNDGWLDYGSNSFGCCAGVHVYLNNQDGTWSQSYGFVGGNSNEDLLFADFNGDGNADMATANSKGTIFLGDGHGNFTNADGNLPPVPSQGRIGISAGDVNGDGRDDLAFVTPQGGLQVWTMVSNGVWQNLSGNLPQSGKWEATQIADMNLDGHGDLIIFGRGNTAVALGDGTGNWTLGAHFQTPANMGYAAFRAGTDLDHNGYPDIGIVAASGGTFNAVNHLGVFVENSQARELRIVAKHPHGGAALVPGAARMIEWNAAAPSELGSATVTLEISEHGGGPWRTIARNLPNTGRYQWRIPPDLSCDTRCEVRYTITAGSAAAMALSHPLFAVPSR